MTWDYRVVRYRDGSGSGLHEVFYDKDGAPSGMTEQPANFVFAEAEDDKAEIVSALIAALRDATRKPVLDEPARWPGENPG